MEYPGLNAIKTAFLICSCTLLCQITFGQKIMIDNSTNRKLNLQLEKSINMRNSVDSICMTYSTITIFVRNNKVIDSVMFTRECPEFIKVAFSEVLPVYKNVDWKNVLHPATPDYDILQPLSYNYSSKTCTDLITTAESKKMLKADLSLRNKKTTAFVLLPIDIKMFELCNYKLSPTHTKN